MKQTIKHFWNDEQGSMGVEYVVLAGIIGVGLIAVIAALTTTVETEFGEIADAVSGS